MLGDRQTWAQTHIHVPQLWFRPWHGNCWEATAPNEGVLAGTGREGHTRQFTLDVSQMEMAPWPLYG